MLQLDHATTSNVSVLTLCCLTMVRPLEMLILSNASALCHTPTYQENVYPKGPSIQFYKLFLDTEVSKQLEMYDALAIIESDVTIAHDTSFERLYKVGSNGWFVYPCFDKASSRERDRERSVVAFNGEVYSFSFIAFHVHSTIQLAFLSSRRTFSALSRSISNMSVF